MLARLRTAPRPARALADVFKRLAQNATAQTRGLTRALGVSGLQQQDAQEYLRLLVGELCEDAALGDRVRSCYEGRAEAFSRRRTPRPSAWASGRPKIREEAFLDVSLDVEAEDGTVEGALQRYLEPEILDGENRWASPAGRCAARKGVRFARLPPAIVLHLKRFAYDYMRDEVRKVGAPLRVPFRLPAAAFERAAPVEEAADAEEGEEAVAPAGAEVVDDDRDPYLLHAVVVHVGGGRGGHYYAYVDPLLDGRWVKFDDDRVSAADARVVAAEAAGAELGGGNSVGAYLPGGARVRGAAARAARWCCRAARNRLGYFVILGLVVATGTARGFFLVEASATRPIRGRRTYALRPEERCATRGSSGGVLSWLRLRGEPFGSRHTPLLASPRG